MPSSHLRAGSRSLVLSFLLVAVVPWAWAEPPSADSIRTLLELTHVHANMDAVMSNMLSSTLMNTRKIFPSQANGKDLSDAQKKVVDKYSARLVELLRQELSWDKLEPQMMKVYQQTYSQEEIDDVIAFYRTPAGQTWAQKMPDLSRKSLDMMGPMYAALGQKIPPLMREMSAELKSTP